MLFFQQLEREKDENKRLKQILEEHYVPFLPPLDDNGSPEQRRKKQVSRAFSAFVLQATLGIDARTAAQHVVDNYNDKGIDAIHYHQENKTLYIVQSKLKATSNLSRMKPRSFVLVSSHLSIMSLMILMMM